MICYCHATQKAVSRIIIIGEITDDDEECAEKTTEKERGDSKCTRLNVNKRGIINRFIIAENQETLMS